MFAEITEIILSAVGSAPIDDYPEILLRAASDAAEAAAPLIVFVPALSSFSDALRANRTHTLTIEFTAYLPAPDYDRDAVGAICDALVNATALSADTLNAVAAELYPDSAPMFYRDLEFEECSMSVETPVSTPCLVFTVRRSCVVQN